MNLDFSIFIFITKLNINFVLGILNTYYRDLALYFYFDFQEYLFKIFTYNLIYDFSGIKSLKRFYVYDFFFSNFFLSLKNNYKIFSAYNKFSDADYSELLLLSSEYVLVPYYYLEE